MKKHEEFAKKFDEVYENSKWAQKREPFEFRILVLLEACMNLMNDYGIPEDEMYEKGIQILNQIKMS